MRNVLGDHYIGHVQQDAGGSAETTGLAALSRAFDQDTASGEP